MMCSFTGCGRPIRTKKSGLCSSHYRMFREGKELRPLKNPTRVQKDRYCKVIGCVDKHYGNGYCHLHWYKDHFYGDPLFIGRLKSYPVEAVCVADGCNQRPVSRWMCQKHYMRFKKYGSHSLPPGVKVSGECLIRDCRGNKHCSKCDTWKPESAFYKNSKQKDGLDYQCKECHNLVNKNRRYNIDLLSTLISQGWKCALCGQTFSDISQTHVDHNHSCCDTSCRSCGFCVRGIICMPCNLMLGVAKDDLFRLRAGVDYLERNKLA